MMFDMPSVFFRELLAVSGTSISLYAIAVALVVSLLLTIEAYCSRESLPGIPRLSRVPVLGALPVYMLHDIPRTLHKLMTIGVDGISYAQIFNTVIVCIQNPMMAKEVLALPDEISSRLGNSGCISWSPFATLQRLIGNTLFSYVGPTLSHRRSLYIMEFMHKKPLYEKFDTMIDIATIHMDTVAGKESTAEFKDLQRSADDFAISLWGELLYGNPNMHLNGVALTLSDKILEISTSPWSSLWHAFQRLLGTVTADEPTSSEAKVRADMANLVDENMAVLEAHEHHHPDTPPKLIRKISLKSGGEFSGPLSEFAYEFTHLNIFGGHHSIGSNITWSLIELNKYPKCLAKLMREIDSVHPNDFAAISSKMPYLDAIILEINRLYPTVHSTVRVIDQEVKLTASGAQSVVLKPGMLVYLSLLHINTSPKYWGDDAGTFVPERFLNKGDQDGRPFMSFGYGPRSCVGYKFAILVVKVYLITLLKSYTVEVTDLYPEVETGALLKTKKSICARICRRV